MRPNEPELESAGGASATADAGKWPASLHRWNVALAALHGVQGLVILALSMAKIPMVSSPVTSSYLSFDAATQTLVPAERVLFDLPIGPAVALFFFLSAIAHLALAYPARRWYEARLIRGQNPARWIEYALSSSVMIVIIATLTGIQEIGALVAIFGINAAMNLFGWSMEAANEGRTRVQWMHYVFGCIAGIVPWIVISIALWTSATEPGAQPIPTFVFVIFVSLFITFNVFAINMVLQYRKRGRWADYLYGEKVYMFLSLFAKTILAWQVFAGTLMP
ncbi:MAG: heliorhodopsin HeR [Chloroflexi bacterium]|nr:heliorhodopsin HeR [Chloroflexota bacterium]